MACEVEGGVCVWEGREVLGTMWRLRMEDSSLYCEVG